MHKTRALSGIRQTAATAALAVAAAMSLAASGEPGSAGAALDRLKAGNARFAVAFDATARSDARRADAPAENPHPFAVVLSCADAHVPAELVFDASAGELFTVRTAGHVADRAGVASIELALEQWRVPLVVVMGHDGCDAVRSAIGSSGAGASENVRYLLDAIRPAFDRLSTPADVQQLRNAVLVNVEQAVNDLLTNSERVRRAVDGGSVQLVGAYYETQSRRVRFSEPVTAVPPSLREGAGGEVR